MESAKILRHALATRAKANPMTPDWFAADRLVSRAYRVACSRLGIKEANAVMAEAPRPSVAYIFEDIGGWYVCSDELDHLDTSGVAHPTKADALRAAAAWGYTHAVGSGTYWEGTRAIPRRFRRGGR